MCIRDRVYAVTFDSRLHPSCDLEIARRVAGELGGIHEVITCLLYTSHLMMKDEAYEGKGQEDCGCACHMHGKLM